MQKVFFCFLLDNSLFINEATKQRSNIWIFDFHKNSVLDFILYNIYYII